VAGVCANFDQKTDTGTAVPLELLPIIDCSNRILRLLGEDEYRALMPALRRTRLPLRQVVCARGETASLVYFPCDCLLSVQALMQDGTAVETATIGNEGFAGIDVLLGMRHWSGTVVCQVEGDCLCMEADLFREAIRGDTGLRRAAQRFVAAYLGLVSQSVACNRLHRVEERFARWMLMTSDRVRSDSFYLTQEFIARMLGVRRPSVSTVASAFQQDGMIRYTRGRVEILDRRRLEQASCECYAACVRQDEELLLPPA
jgi:CRP-like cAMP-binding protein